MKKIYINPCTIIVSVKLESRLLDGSLKVSEDTAGVASGGFVKGNNTSRSDYNVWNEDWSNN